MSVTIPNLRDETISQARAEAQHLLAQAKETHDFTQRFRSGKWTNRGCAQSGHLSGLHALAQGQHIDIQTIPHDLTTTMAAQRIGISRPTLMKAIRSGELPAHKVGSHFRVRTEDADRFRKKLLEKKVAESKQALQDLWAFEEENNLVDVLGGPAW